MGTARRPHGIKGEIGVAWEGEFVPGPDTPIFLRRPGMSPEKFIARSARWHKGNLLLHLEGINDRNAAKELKGAEILLSRRQLPELEPDEAYLRDLPGCAVFLDNGQRIGTLDHFEFPAGQEIWSIRGNEGGEILFPAREEFIKELDVKGGKIVIDPPAGLLEIYRA